MSTAAISGALHRIPHVRLLIAVVVALAVSAGAYAFTASNTVPATTAGSGLGTVSGYTVTNVHYTLNTTTPANIDSLTFTVSPVDPEHRHRQGQSCQAALSTGGPTDYTCTTNTDGRHRHVCDDVAAAHGRQAESASRSSLRSSASTAAKETSTMRTRSARRVGRRSIRLRSAARRRCVFFAPVQLGRLDVLCRRPRASACCRCCHTRRPRRRRTRAPRTASATPCSTTARCSTGRCCTGSSPIQRWPLLPPGRQQRFRRPGTRSRSGQHWSASSGSAFPTPAESGVAWLGIPRIHVALIAAVAAFLLLVGRRQRRRRSIAAAAGAPGLRASTRPLAPRAILHERRSYLFGCASRRFSSRPFSSPSSPARSSQPSSFTKPTERMAEVARCLRADRQLSPTSQD